MTLLIDPVSVGVDEGVRAEALADEAEVAQEAGAFKPEVQGASGRLEHIAGKRRLADQIERERVGRAGRDAGGGAVPAQLDRAMDVAAEDPLDLRIRLDQRAQSLAPRQFIASIAARPVRNGG